MKFTGTTYRPPYEANSLLIQVTVGCAHNKCTYCSMYRDVQFSTENLEQIEQDIQEEKSRYPNYKRAFLVNGDAFVLSATKLKAIAELIIKYFPQIDTITMYASINNIKAKSDDELKMLRDLRINDLWIGVETGHAATLKYMNKGFELQDSYEQLERLNRAGIDHIDIYIFGGAGKGKGIENAIATTKLINATKPIGIATTTMGAFGDTPLARDVENVVFIPATEREVLEEQRTFFELIEVSTQYLGVHAINTVSFDIDLPKNKQLAMHKIDKAIAQLDDGFLDSVPERHSI